MGGAVGQLGQVQAGQLGVEQVEVGQLQGAQVDVGQAEVEQVQGGHVITEVVVIVVVSSVDVAGVNVVPGLLGLGLTFWHICVCGVIVLLSVLSANSIQHIA